MRRATLIAAAAATLFTGAPASAHAAAQTTGRLLVTLESGARAASALTGARRSGEGIPQLRTFAVTGDRATAARLRRRPGVRRVEAEHRYTLRFTPNDPAVNEQEPTGAPPGTPIQWWLQRSDLPAAWDITRGDHAVVAVIDTGADTSHPELAGKVDQAVDTSGSREGAGVDTVGHGTHVASLACGAGDNGIGGSGAGLGCRLLIYKSDLSDVSVVRSIMAAVDAGAHAINMSFGTDGSSPASQTLVEALRYAQQHDVVLVAAAADDPVQEQGDPSNVVQPTGTGNDLTRNGGLSVTAANFADQRAPFAGFGSQISLAAYGSYGQSGGPRGLFGAFPANQVDLERGSFVPATSPCQCRTTFGGDNRYAYLQGTSMAAPQVAAAAALVRELNPDLSGEDVVRLLKQTARRPAGPGWEPNLGWGILDVGAAVAVARSTDLRAPVSSAKAPMRTHKRRITVRLRRADPPADPRLIASGVDVVELYRSVDGGTPRRIARTRKASVVVKGTPGRLYTLTTVAVDKAGNREGQPARADARVRVLRDAR